MSRSLSCIKELVRIVFPGIVIRYFQLVIIRFRYFSKRILIDGSAIVNLSTKLEGYNKIGRNANIANSTIGLGTYISPDCYIPNCQIGRFCSIGPKVEVVLGRHPINFVSTHPAFFSMNKQAGFTFASENLFEEYIYALPSIKKSVAIENDVWIGYGSKIMEGVTLGNGCIIAAGAVVTKDVPPYSIYGGVPANLIKYRFSEKEISDLIKMSWWDFKFEKIKDFSSLFTNISSLIEAWHSNNIYKQE